MAPMRVSPRRPGSLVGLRRSSLVLLAALGLTTSAAHAAPLPKLKVSENKRFLVTEQGKPFFYLGDTAWELFHRLDRRQAVEYLQKRAQQRYTVIQAVALAELEGVYEANAHGDLPLVDKDPARPAITPGNSPGNAQEYDYWDHVDYIVDEANKRGLYIGFLPTWARWARDEKDRIFNEQNAQTYGEFLGKRYGKKGIIWVLGGDRSADGLEGVWRAMARGIAIGATGGENYDAVMMTLHPPGGGTSSRWFHGDGWLDFNMHQTGHSRAEKTRVWHRIKRDYDREPTKPVLDGEPLYEDHPVEFNAKEFGWSFDAHVRQRAYWSVFAGSFGHTYGNHSVWQMYAPSRKPINMPLLSWFEAIHRPGAAQMTYVRALVESRPMLSRVPDQSLVEDALEGADHVAGTRGDGYAFIYSPMGRKFTAVLGKLPGAKLNVWWFNPRTGTAMARDPIDNKGTMEFVPPSEGFGGDWVLVLDDAGRGFRAPGAPGPVMP
jgi:hypothetical protein